MSKNYNITTIKKAIDGSGGLYTQIAKKLRCEWHTAKTYVEKHEETKKAYDTEMESNLDLAELKLLENINDNDNVAIIFYLKTKGKKRGYVERLELETKNQQPIFQNISNHYDIDKDGNSSKK